MTAEGTVGAPTFLKKIVVMMSQGKLRQRHI
jgi:hypothetical protein